MTITILYSALSGCIYATSGRTKPVSGSPGLMVVSGAKTDVTAEAIEMVRRHAAACLDAACTCKQLADQRPVPTEGQKP